jgi:hypothetical protein
MNGAARQNTGTGPRRRFIEPADIACIKTLHLPLGSIDIAWTRFGKRLHLPIKMSAN